MSSNRPLLADAPHIVDPADEMAKLREDLHALRSELEDFREEFEQGRDRIGNLYHALRAIFGSDGATTPSGASAPSKSDAGWEKWKAKLGGKQAEIIQTLLDHGPMTRSQLRVATGSGMSTVDQCIYKLRDLGLVVRHGDSWRLKA
jgi:hypothetical protein